MAHVPNPWSGQQWAQLQCQEDHPHCPQPAREREDSRKLPLHVYLCACEEARLRKIELLVPFMFSWRPTKLSDSGALCWQNGCRQTPDSTSAAPSKFLWDFRQASYCFPIYKIRRILLLIPSGRW